MTSNKRTGPERHKRTLIYNCNGGDNKKRHLHAIQTQHTRRRAHTHTNNMRHARVGVSVRPELRHSWPKRVLYTEHAVQSGRVCSIFAGKTGLISMHSPHIITYTCAIYLRIRYAYTHIHIRSRIKGRAALSKGEDRDPNTHTHARTIMFTHVFVKRTHTTRPLRTLLLLLCVVPSQPEPQPKHACAFTWCVFVCGMLPFDRIPPYGTATGPSIHLGGDL